MKKVIFYLIEYNDNIPQSTSAAEEKLSLHETIACQKIAEYWQRQRIQVACETQQQAELIDEYLWQLDFNDFIPHNLAGEGPKMGAPVEISWPDKRGNTSRQLLVNLQSHYTNFMAVFNDIIDFVPPDESLKILARERYKQYKNAGFNIKTIKYQ